MSCNLQLVLLEMQLCNPPLPLHCETMLLHCGMSGSIKSNDMVEEGWGGGGGYVSTCSAVKLSGGCGFWVSVGTKVWL